MQSYTWKVTSGVRYIIFWCKCAWRSNALTKLFGTGHMLVWVSLPLNIKIFHWFGGVSARNYLGYQVIGDFDETLHGLYNYTLSFNGVDFTSVSSCLVTLSMSVKEKLQIAIFAKPWFLWRESGVGLLHLFLSLRCTYTKIESTDKQEVRKRMPPNLNGDSAMYIYTKRQKLSTIYYVCTVIWCI